MSEQQPNEPVHEEVYQAAMEGMDMGDMGGMDEMDLQEKMMLVKQNEVQNNI
jgi:hypothetical protein